MRTAFAFALACRHNSSNLPRRDLSLSRSHKSALYVLSGIFFVLCPLVEY